MKAKYPGRCTKCGGIINVGDKIEWTPATRARHIICPTQSQSKQNASKNIEAVEFKPVEPEPIYQVPEDQKPVIIKPYYYDGEYLSGFMVHDGNKELEALGLGRYVDGWGFRISEKIITEIGQEFTLQQAEDYARPTLEAAAKAKADKINQKNEKKSGAFAEAKRTNQPVIIKQWSTECNHEVEECDIDDLTQYAMPDGSTKTTRSHSY